MQSYPEAFYSRFKIGDIVRHFKWFNLSREEAENCKYIYRILSIARSTVNEELVVVYANVSNPEEVWVRPLEEFCSEVDRTKFTDACQHYRFEVI